MALPKLVWTILVPLLQMLIKMLSPTIKTEMAELLQQLHAKALSTPNPADDLCTEALASLLGIDVSDVKAEINNPDAKVATATFVEGVVQTVKAAPTENACDSVVPEEPTEVSDEEPSES